MTPRLSSVCSNQLSYRPACEPEARNLNINREIQIACTLGGKGTRTPDIQLAKLALYQLSYAPWCRAPEQV